MNIVFLRNYNLREQEVKFVQGQAGVYFIFLTDLRIAYPFHPSGLIYIGMSESRQNSIAMRLRGHLTGQSGNLGISNYAKNHQVKFTTYSFEVLRNYGNDNLFDIESFFLSDFLEKHGAFPICNGQAGHQLSTPEKNIAARVEWSFFW